MLKSTCRFFKDKKIVEPVGHVHFVVFETFQVLITPNCTRNRGDCCYLLIMYRGSRGGGGWHDNEGVPITFDQDCSVRELLPSFCAYK